MDIETSLIETYSFGIRDQHITHKQIKDLQRSGRTIHCVGMKWSDKRKPVVLTEWGHGYREMLQGTFDALCEADAVATYNGVRFDLPKLEGQFALHDMGLPPPPANIDIWLTARKWGFPSSKLDYLAPLFGLGSKVQHPGLQMWMDVYEGCPKAQKQMTTYCAGDVLLTEEFYNRARSYIRNHPHLHGVNGACPNCGSTEVEGRGWRPTRTMRFQRLYCRDCKSWHKGKGQRL